MALQSAARNRPELAQICPMCQGKKIGIGEAKNRKSEQIFPYYCLECGHVFSVYAPRIKADRYAARCGELEKIYTVRERWIAEGKIDLTQENRMQPCEACGTVGWIELHHWAPKHLFGKEAHKWPTANLCRECHVRWHKIVTPNMGRLQE